MKVILEKLPEEKIKAKKSLLLYLNAGICVLVLVILGFEED